MSVEILNGDCREVLAKLPEKSVNCCVTSPPYWGLRDYGVDGQIGQEPTPEEYVSTIVEVFRGIHRVLRDDGTLWLNLGDSYASGGRGGGSKRFGENQSKAQGLGRKKPTDGYKPKDLVGIPWMVAFALRSDGWYLRQDIIWSKPNHMPESVTDRCTKSHEYIFLLSKSSKYFYDFEAIKEPAQNWGKRDRSNMRGGTTDPKLKHHGLGGAVEEDNPMKNKRSVWTVTTKGFNGAHFACFPTKLIEPCILAGCPKGGTVIDPFGGSGTTGEVAIKHRRNAILIELNPDYIELQKKRTSMVQQVLI